MSIFAKPKEMPTQGPKILFLHGLEGSAQGQKASHLKNVWNAHTPSLRTSDLYELKNKCNNDWKRATEIEIDDAMSSAYQDAIDAVNYLEPDIVIGSSLGAALLYKLYAEGAYKGAGILLAPAIPLLLSEEVKSLASHEAKNSYTFWILGELDEIVPNSENAMWAKQSESNLIYSPGDSHRLSLALENGLIDAAVLSAIEDMEGN